MSVKWLISRPCVSWIIAHDLELKCAATLEKHAVPSDVINDVFKRLERSGLVNDERFAQDWVENRSEFRPRSRRALAFELHQRGLDDSAIEKALEGLNEEALAYQAALKQSRRYEGLEMRDFRNKLGSYLATKRFLL